MRRKADPNCTNSACGVLGRPTASHKTLYPNHLHKASPEPPTLNLYAWKLFFSSSLKVVRNFTDSSTLTCGLVLANLGGAMCCEGFGRASSVQACGKGGSPLETPKPKLNLTLKPLYPSASPPQLKALKTQQRFYQKAAPWQPTNVEGFGFLRVACCAGTGGLGWNCYHVYRTGLPADWIEVQLVGKGLLYGLALQVRNGWGLGSLQMCLPCRVPHEGNSSCKLALGC